MKPIKILLVEWEDTSESGGWFPADGHEERYSDTAKCYEVGHKVKETAKILYVAKVYAHHAEGEPQWGGITAIPRGCIRRITVLKTLKACADSEGKENGR